MLTEEKIKMIQHKMVEVGIKQTKLARYLHCSNTCLSLILNQKKNLPLIEKRLNYWLNDELIIDFNIEDYRKDKNYVQNKLKEKKQNE